MLAPPLPTIDDDKKLEPLNLSPDGGGVTRAAVHRLAADGYDSTANDSRSSVVATCRQTLEALLAPLSTAWQRMATGKEPKEKGLLLHPPLSHEPTYTKQRPYHHHARLRHCRWGG